ncbi:low molecular weight protein-tyrosine-phosphatase [Actinomyces vulturis]|uniref:low molecular weight protein-tyrosine-phosphatase n=1 Tax=Actinomyces vulturis TaxID=1857645 RepID=UPI00083328B8|nr:low molecular weight protein-tyrosine-phosphatase [Actinomyces vulturis]
MISDAAHTLPAPLSPSAPYHVLMVCTGNICRSTTAHMILADLLERAELDRVVSVDSAGISDEEHGNPIDHRARRVLEREGYTIRPHQAHRATDEELRRSDLIIAMTDWHYRDLTRRMHKLGLDTDRVRMMREFSTDASIQALSESVRAGHEPRSVLDVDDPWYGDAQAFEVAYAIIEDACGNLLKHLGGYQN